MTRRGESIPELVEGLYPIVRRLEIKYPGRRFTPDGHPVGSLGDERKQEIGDPITPEEAEKLIAAFEHPSGIGSEDLSLIGPDLPTATAARPSLTYREGVLGCIQQVGGASQDTIE